MCKTLGDEWDMTEKELALAERVAELEAELEAVLDENSELHREIDDLESGDDE